MKAYLFRPHGMGKKSCDAIAALSKTGITVVESKVDAHPKDPHLCIRYGCTSDVPANRLVLNKLANMRVTMDKGGFRRKMQEHMAGLCPPSWADTWGVKFTQIPAVVRPARHAQASDFFLCRTAKELYTAYDKAGPGWYAAKYIEKVAEYRVNVLQGRVLCIIGKGQKDEKDTTWSKGKTYVLRWSEWPQEAVTKAVIAVNLAGLDFAGVDVIQDKDGKCYVLEVNTNPYLEGPYQQQCFTKGFDYVVEKGRDRIPLTTNDWKGYIHPAVSDMAR